jgi:gas vesicle structural protein
MKGMRMYSRSEAGLDEARGPQRSVRHRLRRHALEGRGQVLVDRDPNEISGVDVIDRVLDKGIVVDGWARVSLVGVLDLVTFETRVVVASIETYLKYADAFGGALPIAGALVPIMPSVPDQAKRVAHQRSASAHSSDQIDPPSE